MASEQAHKIRIDGRHASKYDLQLRVELPDGARSRNSDTRGGREAAALRLLGAERSEEIFPILLEEIVNSGYPRFGGAPGNVLLAFGIQ